MASADEAAYHRTFLAPNYWDNFHKFTRGELARRRTEEVDRIRDQDLDAFEDRRKMLAQMLRVPYRSGYEQTYPGDQGGRDHWVEGVPSDAAVAECMAPLYPPQGVVTSPTTGMMALPMPGVTRTAFLHGKTLLPVQ